MSKSEVIDFWAIVDQMGHTRFIGRVTEQVIAGEAFIRVDVPEYVDETSGETQQAFSKLLGPKSIHGISPVSEDVARLMIAQQRRQTPISLYELPERPAITARPSVIVDTWDPQDDMEDAD